MRRWTPILAAAFLLASCGKDGGPVPVGPGTDEGYVDFGFDLPTLVIDTPYGVPVTSKTEWIDGAESILYIPGGKVQNLGAVKIKGRGNNTWRRDKKPYALKFESNVEPLGMPSDKRWDLLANWLDITKLRNEISFKLAACCEGLDWTPHSEFVELILNGMHYGNYQLTEHIKIDKFRVNIPDGGYILEFDSYYDRKYKFKTSIKSLPVNLKDPDDNISDEFFKNVRSDINAVENAICKGGDWQSLIDLDSFVDFYLVNEITGSRELRHPKSAYFHKSPGGPLVAGPVWDFDYGTFREDRVTGWYSDIALWYPELLKKPEFVSSLKTHWGRYKRDFYRVVDGIDDMAGGIVNSVERDNLMWPIDADTNLDNTLAFTDAVRKMKNVIYGRLNWLDTAIPNL